MLQLRTSVNAARLELPVFQVAFKPVGPACNLNCDYCYYLHKEQLLNLPGLSRMSRVDDSLLERFVEQYISSQRYPETRFLWHGGEPTLLGLDFFRKVVELQRKHTPAGMLVTNDLQTNGVLLDDEWCEFLAQHRFLVGLSIDGPRELHDAVRPSAGGQATFTRVYEAARRLQKHHVGFNTLTVVSPANVQHPDVVYDFLTRDLGSKYLQILPCAEHRDFSSSPPGDWHVQPVAENAELSHPEDPMSLAAPWSISAADWGRFLCQFFDRWHSQDIGRIRVNLFDSWIAQWAGGPAQICVFAETCGNALTVELDGSVYSCDHYVYPEHRLGGLSIGESLAAMVRSEKQSRFGLAKRESLPLYCHSCEFNFACHGECPRRRFISTPDGEPGLNYLCEGYKNFFYHARGRLAALAALVNRHAPPDEPAP